MEALGYLAGDEALTDRSCRTRPGEPSLLQAMAMATRAGRQIRWRRRKAVLPIQRLLKTRGEVFDYCHVSVDTIVRAFFARPPAVCLLPCRYSYCIYENSTLYHYISEAARGAVI